MPEHEEYFKPRNYFPDGLIAPSRVRHLIQSCVYDIDGARSSARERIRATLQLAEISTQYAQLQIDALERTERGIARGTTVQLGAATEGDKA